MARVGWIDQRDLNYSALVIADEESGDAWEIQRSLTNDPQDLVLGMDTYCLVRGGAAHYGGIETYEIGDSSVGFVLARNAAEALELPESFEVSVGPDGVALLRQRLPSLLR